MIRKRQITEQQQIVAQLYASINHELQVRFAPEDAALRGSIARAQAENLPTCHISPLQGKLLQILTLAIGARHILEIGALAGYSSVWLARGLPSDGKLISLEIDPRHAEIAHKTLTEAGVNDRTEVRIGAALDLLPTLVQEAPFDLIFIDADKENYTQYLDWAITLSRPGSLIIADNVIRGGSVFQTPPPDAITAGGAAYLHKVLEHPRLVSIAIPNDDDGDGFAISIVQG